jgi:CRP-like cAMP-binding protein
VIIGDAGKEAVLATLGAGECVGEMGLLDNAPHDATVIAQTPVDVLLLNRQAFHNSINSNPALGVAVMRSLVGRLRLANQKIASLALVSVYGRVAQHLISEATANPSGELLIQKKLSPVALSRVLGASRETIGQTLKTLENQTFIERMQSGQFKINPQVLQNRSELELQIPLNVHQVNRSLMQQATVH